MTLQREIEQVQGHLDHHAPQQEPHLLSLEGQPAFPFESTRGAGSEDVAGGVEGQADGPLLWAHWCGDCKTQGPILDAFVTKYKSSGITVIAPTQRFGYVEKRKPAGPAEELAYIERIRDHFYPWMKTTWAPISDEVYMKYGVSTTPTYVMIDRDGKVSSTCRGSRRQSSSSR